MRGRGRRRECRRGGRTDDHERPRAVTTARLLCTLLLASRSQHAGTASLQERERYGSLQPRVSTKKEVYQRFGQPAEVLAVDGGSTWLYAQAASPAGGLFTGGKTVGVTLATFRFDAGDLYQRVDTDRERRPQPRRVAQAGHHWAMRGRRMYRGNGTLRAAV